MKYVNGDIVVNIRTRLLFVWDETSFKKNYLTMHKTRLATPGEAHIFNTKFPKAKVVTFDHFKEEMVVFDGRKLGKSTIYSHIELREDEYLYFRRFRNDNFIHVRNFEDKLSVLITEYEKHKAKEVDQMEPYYKKFLQVEKLITEVINDIENKVGNKTIQTREPGLIKSWGKA